MTEWTLVSKEPPKADGWYLTITKRSNGEWNLPDSTEYKNGIWYTHFKVVGWMQIPKYPEV